MECTGLLKLTLSRKEKVRINNKRFYKEHRQKMIEKSRKYRLEHPEKGKENYRKNSKNILKNKRARYKITRIHTLEVSKIWKKNNPEKQLIYAKTRLKKYASVFKMNSLQYRYAKQDWSKVIKYLDNNMCKNCDFTENLHAHHIIPKSHQPELSLDLDNGITLCHYCHKLIHLTFKS